ncbi:putative reverse transcriptase domain-containing protein [Tanacetum coccineum]
MTTTNQGMSFAEVEQIVAQRVANAIETIAIYEAKARVARDLMNRVKQQEDKITENASNKRKWEGDHKGSSSQQQNKEPKDPSPKSKTEALMAKQKAKFTCYACGELGHYKSDCPMWKFRNRVNEYWKEKALGDSSVVTNNVDV